MFLVVLLILVLVSLLFSVKEGMDYTVPNQNKFDYYQVLQDTYSKYQNILDLTV
jgi:regulator of protease activity HflC (stomatin/prohibitin superfamily)